MYVEYIIKAHYCSTLSTYVVFLAHIWYITIHMWYILTHMWYILTYMWYIFTQYGIFLHICGIYNMWCVIVVHFSQVNASSMTKTLPHHHLLSASSSDVIWTSKVSLWRIRRFFCSFAVTCTYFLLLLHLMCPEFQRAPCGRIRRFFRSIAVTCTPGRSLWRCRRLFGVYYLVRPR